MSTEVQFPTVSQVKVIIELSVIAERPNKTKLFSSPVIEQEAERPVESAAEHVMTCEIRLVDVWHRIH